MAKYLDETGLAHFWDNIKTQVQKPTNNLIDNSIIQFTFEIPQGHDTQGGCPFSASGDYTFDANGLYFATITGKTDNTLRKLWIHDHEGVEIAAISIPDGHWGNCFYKNGYIYSYNSLQSGAGDEKLYRFDVSNPAAPTYTIVQELTGSYTGACDYIDNKILLYTQVDTETFSFYTFDLVANTTEYVFDIPREHSPLFGSMATFTYCKEDNTLLRNGVRPNTVIVYSVATLQKCGVHHVADFNGFSDVGEMESFIIIGSLCYYHSLYAGQNIVPISSTTVTSDLIHPRVVQWFYTDMRGLSTNQESWTDGHIIKLDYNAVTHGRNYFTTGPVCVVVKYAFQALACLRYMRSNLSLNISSQYPWVIVLYDVENITISASANTIKALVLTKADNIVLSMAQTAFTTATETDSGYIYNNRAYRLYCDNCGVITLIQQWRNSKVLDTTTNRFAMFYRVGIINALAIGYTYFRQSMVKAQEIKNCWFTNAAVGIAPSTTLDNNTAEAASASYIIGLPTSSE